MKKVLILGGATLFVVAAPQLSIRKTTTKKATVNLAVGLAEAFAADPPGDDCQTAFKAVIAGEPKDDAYADKILLHLHRELYRFNKVQSADIEMIFCRMNKVMGINPDTSNLATAQTATKTDPLGKVIVATVEAPTEAWATAAGYTAKASVTADGTQFLALWWSGSGDTSKGYVIQGNNPMKSDGNSRLRYVQWDRTSDAQTLKFMGTQFGSAGYLQAAGAGATSQTGGDHAVYARLTYNNSTKAIDAQNVFIRAGNTAATASTFKCVKTYFTGTLGGTVTGFRPAQGTPEAATTTTKDGTGLDGEKDVVDSPTTADHSGSPVAGSTMTSTFDKSCNDIYTANASGNPFYSTGSTTATVSYTMAPTTVFP